MNDSVHAKVREAIGHRSSESQRYEGLNVTHARGSDAGRVIAPRRLWMLLALLAGSLALAILYWYFVRLVLPQNVPGGADLRSEFGNMFGALNAVFSAFAFSGLIYAIFLQRDDLALQREELALQREELVATRGELSGQREQLELQNKGLAVSRFYDGFFRMLTLQTEITGSVIYQYPGLPERAMVGRPGLVVFEEEVRSHAKSFPNDDINAVSKRCANATGEIIKRQGANLDQYFKTFTELLRIAVNGPAEEREPAVRIICAQLSATELALLLYYIQTVPGHKALAELVGRAGLFWDIQPNPVINCLRHTVPNTAFQPPRQALGESGGLGG